MISAKKKAEWRRSVRKFVEHHIAPQASSIDREQSFPEGLIRALADKAYLVPWLAQNERGFGLSWTEYGVLHEEVGCACSATRSLLTVQSMVAHAIQRCGSRAQKEQHLPLLATGGRIAALAVTEPEVGSDAAHPRTSAEVVERGYRLDGQKRWITFGERADLFLVLASCNGKPAAFLVEADRPGLSVSPVRDLLGIRGAMHADLHFKGCAVPPDSRLGREGLGFTMVVSTALDLGRFSVACGCLGMLRACLEACADYSSVRKQFGTEIRNHQLVRRIMTRMLTDLRCAELLCQRAAALRDSGDPAALAETMIAKYFTATAAKRAADEAVQLHGANGCSSAYSVERIYRDAKIMEIIEGSTQMQEITIADYAYQRQFVAGL